MNAVMRERIEVLCEQFVLTHPDDARALEELAAALEDVRALADDQGAMRLADAAGAAAKVVEWAKRKGADSRGGSLELVGRTLTAMRELACDGAPAESVSYPAELEFFQSPTDATGGVDGEDQTEPSETGDALAGSSTPLRVVGRRPEEKEEEEAPLVGETFDPLDDAELLGIFATELAENLLAAESSVLAVEKDPADQEHIGALFRVFHTIKGGARYLHLDELVELAHEMEELLELIRDRQLGCTSTEVDLALASIDLFRRMGAAIQAVAEEGGGLSPIDGVNPLIKAIRAQLVVRAQQAEQHPADLVEEALASDQRGEARPQTAPAEPQELAAELAADGSGDSIRVDAQRLDKLVDAIGELVIATSMANRLATRIRDEEALALQRQLASVQRISQELHELGMALRMVPLRGTFQRMKRLVRDLGKREGKELDFVIAGEEIELDKAIVDRLADPLIHLLRNAVDHGLESAAERLAADKPARGRVELRAFHRRGGIHIEVRDDGRGLDVEAIRARAEELSLGSPSGDAEGSDRDAVDLIFAPGLSTAARVTDISGRGVGLDVVRQSLQALRAQITVRSEPRKGTLFSIRLPRILAVIDGMVVRVGGERYILPTLSVVRTLDPDPSQLATVLNRGQLLRVGDELLPVFRLSALIDAERRQAPTRQGIVVVLEGEDRRAGIFVDELLGKMQVVIKSLGDVAQQYGLGYLSGAAIMPDGQVGVILDPDGVMRLAQRVGATSSRPPLRHGLRWLGGAPNPHAATRPA